MKKIKMLMLVLAVCVMSKTNAQTVTKYSPADLTKWQSLGDGLGTVMHGQYYMEEIDGSIGFMIFSPEKYTDVILRYEVMTMNPATVLVAILNASDLGSSTDLTITDENKGSFGFWTKEVEDYMFGFRVMPHNSTPFLRKFPVAGGGNGNIGLAEKDVIRPGWRYLVECGKQGTKLWLKIDGETIIEANDDKPMDAGKIAIRVRGTGSDLGKCMIRNLEIVGEPVK